MSVTIAHDVHCDLCGDYCFYLAVIESTGEVAMRCCLDCAPTEDVEKAISTHKRLACDECKAARGGM